LQNDVVVCFVAKIACTLSEINAGGEFCGDVVPPGKSQSYVEMSITMSAIVAPRLCNVINSPQRSLIQSKLARVGNNRQEINGEFWDFYQSHFIQRISPPFGVIPLHNNSANGRLRV
jgi:hypothetical protein